MQVSKWLGHRSYVLTLSTYADYIREDDTAAPNSHVRLQQSRITGSTRLIVVVDLVVVSGCDVAR